jgi:ankyrin repeat protein
MKERKTSKLFRAEEQTLTSSRTHLRPILPWVILPAISVFVMAGTQRDSKPMNEQDSNVGANRGRRTRPLLGLQGPFSALTAQRESQEQFEQKQDPAELFRILRADPSNSGIGDLILASRSGYREMVDHLIEQGNVNIDEHEEGGATALIEAVTYGHFDIALLLIERGADVKATTSSAWTPLHFVASHGPESLAKEIVAREANVNASADLGLTPLMIAARRGRFPMVKFLIGAGADINPRDSTAATALLHAAKGDQDESGGDSRSVAALVAAGSDINVQDVSGISPLMAVCFYGDLASVRLLLDRGVDINARDGSGRTALAIAEEGQSQEIVHILRASGATH